MKWGELDLDRAMWSLPPERTKNGLPHDVPLSLQAVAILRSIKARDGRELLFGHAEGPFSDWSKSHERINARIACRRAEARLGRSLEPDEQPSVGDAIAPWTLHDLRRTVVTGMNELGIQPHVVEAVVNHVSRPGQGRSRRCLQPRHLRRRKADGAAGLGGSPRPGARARRAQGDPDAGVGSWICYAPPGRG